MRRPVKQRVAVVGGGAAGTVAAAHLLREPREDSSLEVVLIDRDGEFGRGVAYGTSDPMHLLNVPAVRMGAVCGHPEHFHEWLCSQAREEAGAGDCADPAVAEEAFLPRGLYGTYLLDLLDRAEREAGDSATLERRVGDVVGIAEDDDGEGVTLTFADGEEMVADRAVLALGPLSGGDPIPIPPELRASGRYVADPWADGALDRARSEREVLIVGTGLSTVDVALGLGGLPRGPRIRAVSRHGLVPRRHRRDLTRLRRFPLPTESGDLAPVLAAIFAQVCHVSQQGDDWRDVIDSMRPVSPALWKSLKLEEKKRFLRDYQRLWDVHRFRMAPDVADRLEELEAAERVSFGAGSIVALEPHAGGVHVSLRTLGQHELDIVDVGAIVNCTGAGTDLRRAAPPVLQGLLEAGTARADDLGLGVVVDDDGALLPAEGATSAGRIFVVGSLRKGVEWEAIGITEIRDHSGAIARKVIGAAEAVAAARAEAPTLVQPLPRPVFDGPIGEAAA
jgi:uncharacterized NAD(P)/FAD-binding protein YdhS